MAKQQHTPTPWRCHPTLPGVLIAPDGKQITAAWHTDALLQAISAHEELVAALRAIIFQVNQGKVLERDACITQARTALAKAEGR